MDSSNPLLKSPMRALRLATVLSIVCGACGDPAEPAQPWIAGRWLLVDSLAVTYAYPNYLGSGRTMTYSLLQARDATLDVVPVGVDSMLATIRGTAHDVVRSSVAGDGEEVWPIDFDYPIRFTTRYVYGAYAGEPRDSLPLPAAPATRIDWDADSLFLCGEWRQGVGPDVLPGSFACRHRIHWRRP